MFMHICSMAMCMDMLVDMDLFVEKDLAVVHGIDRICDFSQKVDFMGYDDIG
jgi:hypothetical protein